MAADIRTDPLTGATVIFDEARTHRPRNVGVTRTLTDDACPFCPGRENDTPPELAAHRPRGAADTPGWTVRVVPNRYPAFPRHEVVIVSDDHGARLSTMEIPALTRALTMAAGRVGNMAADPDVDTVVWFQNHGPLAGATQPHAHWQIAGLPVPSPKLEAEIEHALRVWARDGECGYCGRVGRLEAGRGVHVAENEHYVAFAPIAPRVPYETWIVPRAHAAGWRDVIPESDSLAALVRDVFSRIDRVLDEPDSNLICHAVHETREGNVSRAYHWHLELLPRVVRVAGFEWGSGLFLNGIRPERAAEDLRGV